MARAKATRRFIHLKAQLASTASAPRKPTDSSFKATSLQLNVLATWYVHEWKRHIFIYRHIGKQRAHFGITCPYAHAQQITPDVTYAAIFFPSSKTSP